MRPWVQDPSPELETVFAHIARTRMADVPLCNAALRVEAIGFRPGPGGHWVGVMVTPWAINLLCLPRQAEHWPALPAGAKHDWGFPSGAYEFTVAEESSLGAYHLCSLFSPVLEFASHDQAQLTARAAVEALFAEPVAATGATPAGASRRAFLGLRG